MKLKRSSIIVAACMALIASVSHGALIANGDLETTVVRHGGIYGNSVYSLDETTGLITETGTGAWDPTGASVNEWVMSGVSRGFTYDAAGGNGGGGAFVRNGANQNEQARAVQFFAQDNKATTGDVTISLDTFLVNDNNGGAGAIDLYLRVELYAWNAGQAGVGMSMAASSGDKHTYFVTDLGDATTLLNKEISIDGSKDVTVAGGVWDTADLGTVALGTGYDFYAWRVGAVGADAADTFSFDNLTIDGGGPPVATINSFTIDGGSTTAVEVDDEVALAWNTLNGTATLDGSPVSAIGTTNLTVAGPTTYTLIVSGASSSATGTVTATIAPLEIVSFTASETSVKPGDTITLEWDVLSEEELYLNGVDVFGTDSNVVTITSGPTNFVLHASALFGFLNDYVTNNIEVIAAAPPVWTDDPITGKDALNGVPYNSTLAGKATETNGDPITYSLVDVGTWLSVASDGTLSGTPDVLGPNTFTVTATDVDGSTNATLNIEVAAIPYGSLITNGDLNTPVVRHGGIYGNSVYTLNEATGAIVETGTGAWDPTGAFVNEWVMGGLSRGFTYDATNGVAGGGAFVRNGTNQNKKPRGVLFFAQDSKATTGNVTLSLDTFLADNTGDGILFLTVELYAWNSGDTGVGLSMGGENADDPTYFVTTNVTTTLLNTSVGIGDVTTNTWDTASLGTVALGTGYDFYAWRIGVVGAEGTDEFSFDNLTLVGNTSGAQVTDLAVAGLVDGGTGLALSWTGEDGKPYGVETNADLIIPAGWGTYMTGIMGDGGTITITNAIGTEGQLFYQVISE